MVFSLLSIIISVFSILTRKSVLRAAGHYEIKFDITGLSNIKKCRNLVKDIEKALATSFGLDPSLFEISRPMQIPKGLQLSIDIRMNNVQQIDMNIVEMMKELNESGELAKILQQSWTLKELPSISNIKCHYNQSQNRQDNEVVIESVPGAPYIEMISGSMSPSMIPPIVETNDYIAEHEGKANRNGNLMRDTQDNNAGDIITKLDENVASANNDLDGIDDIDNVINNSMNDVVTGFDDNTPGHGYADDNFATLDDKDKQIVASLNQTKYDNAEGTNMAKASNVNGVEVQDDYRRNV